MKNPRHWNCIDCGVNTAKGGPTDAFVRRKSKPGVIKAWFADETWEVYEVKRSGRRLNAEMYFASAALTPADFTDGELNQFIGTKRLFSRKGYRGTRKIGVAAQSIQQSLLGGVLNKKRDF
jgi:hypothetical protein